MGWTLRFGTCTQRENIKDNAAKHLKQDSKKGTADFSQKHSFSVHVHTHAMGISFLDTGELRKRTCIVPISFKTESQEISLLVSTRDCAGVVDKMRIFVSSKKLQGERKKVFWRVLQHAALASASCAL